MGYANRTNLASGGGVFVFVEFAVERHCNGDALICKRTQQIKTHSRRVPAGVWHFFLSFELLCARLHSSTGREFSCTCLTALVQNNELYCTEL